MRLSLRLTGRTCTRHAAASHQMDWHIIPMSRIARDDVTRNGNPGQISCVLNSNDRHFSMRPGRYFARSDIVLSPVLFCSTSGCFILFFFAGCCCCCLVPLFFGGSYILISSAREWEGVFSIYSRTVTKGRQQPQIVGKTLSDIELVMPWRQRFKDLMVVAR